MDTNKPLSADQAARAEQALDTALGKIEEVSPELAKKIQEKYEQDRREFAQAAQDFCPSQDADYWAKKSCRKCYGRGIIGTKHVFLRGAKAESGLDSETGQKVYTNSMGKQELRCTCTSKNYQKWLAEFRLFYNALKAQMAEEGEPDDESLEEKPSEDNATQDQEAIGLHP